LAKTYLYYYYIIKETNDFMKFPLKKKGGIKRRDQKEGLKRGIKRRDQKEGSKGRIKRRDQKGTHGSL
jgi:hypothetical protein